MRIDKKLPNSSTAVAIIVRSRTKARLKSTCFRGTSLVKAGNFCLWDSTENLLRDTYVINHFLAEIHDLWKAQKYGAHSLCIAHPTPVGWESTTPIKGFDMSLLEGVDLGRNGWGLRVKTEHTELLAPKTDELTLVYQLKHEDGMPIAVIHSVYPGVDVGELEGNVTEREKRVFFDWNHPGQP